jgi:PAS domain S-box-containing protein
MANLDFAAFVDAAADAIIAAGADGRILLWNRAAARIFGYTADEALGQSLDLIIPERFRAETEYGSEVLRVPAEHRGGHSLSIAFTVTLLELPEGRGRAIAAIMRDETARWNEERDLRRRLADLEAKKA